MLFVVRSLKPSNESYTPKSKKTGENTLIEGIKVTTTKVFRKVAKIMEELIKSQRISRDKKVTRIKIKHGGRSYRMMRVSTTILAMQGVHGKPAMERMTTFESDALPIGIDNRCSAYISPYLEDFVGPLETCERVIKGFHGAKVHTVKRGTIR